MSPPEGDDALGKGFFPNVLDIDDKYRTPVIVTKSDVKSKVLKRTPASDRDVENLGRGPVLDS